MADYFALGEPRSLPQPAIIAEVRFCRFAGISLFEYPYVPEDTRRLWLAVLNGMATAPPPEPPPAPDAPTDGSGPFRIQVKPPRR